MWVHSPRSTILASRKEIRWQGRFRTIGFTWCCSTIPQTQAIGKCQQADAAWIWFWCCHRLEGYHTKANGFPPSRIYMVDYFLSGLYVLTNLAWVTLLGAGCSCVVVVVRILKLQDHFLLTWRTEPVGWRKICIRSAFPPGMRKEPQRPLM